MIRYKSSSGKSSGVKGYEIGDDFITVQFATHTYLYTYASAGKIVIEQMKNLAEINEGLSTYISQNNPDYERSWLNSNNKKSSASH